MKLTTFLAFGAAVLATSAQADPVTYTLTTVGSGTLGVNPFNNAAITITATADTSDITFSSHFGSYQVVDLSSSIFIAGLGSADFTSTMDFANQSVGTVGISANPSGDDILDCVNPVFDTYNLSTSIGPVSGSPIINSAIPVETTAGELLLTGASTVTFQAVVVPEPSTLALGGLGGVLGLVAFRRLRSSEYAAPAELTVG